MTQGFQNLPLEVSTRDGRNFVLLKESVYVAKDGTQYCLPFGAESDGASTPQAIWNLIPPFGPYWPAAVLHDCAYRNTLQIWNGSDWVKASLSKNECDDLLLEAMASLGVGMVERETIYEGVVIGGTSSFEKDRAQSS